MNGETIEDISFYTDLEFLFKEYLPNFSIDEEFEYSEDDLHSMWVYLYKNGVKDISCYRDIDIKATLLFSKTEEFIEKHYLNNYPDALCLIVLLQQKLNTLLNKYYKQRLEASYD